MGDTPQTTVDPMKKGLAQASPLFCGDPLRPRHIRAVVGLQTGNGNSKLAGAGVDTHNG